MTTEVVATAETVGAGASFLSGVGTGGISIVVGYTVYGIYDFYQHGHPSPTGPIAGDIGNGAPKPNINYDLINKLIASMAAAEEANRIAQDIISKERKGSINKEFPDQFRNKTLAEIEKAANEGIDGAKKALKLLRDGRFKK